LSTCYVIDTNVIAVAAGAASHVSEECVRNAQEFLFKVRNKGVVVLDYARKILEEYHRQLKDGQPTLGHEFFIHLVNNVGNPDVVSLVAVEHLKASPWTQPFPDEDCFEKFDRSDRKFLAAALLMTSQSRDVAIVNATDSDWAEIAACLEPHSIRLIELC